MLRKIYKHEMAMTSRSFIPMILGFIALAILGKVSLELSINPAFNPRIINTITMIFNTLYFIYIIAIFIMTSVFIVTHFYKTMTGDQGYLTHTLPAKTSTIISGKLLCAATWEIITFLFVLLSFIIYSLGHFSFSDLQILWAELMQFFNALNGVNIPIIILQLVVGLLCLLFSGPLMFYASIAIGHLFQKHRVLCSVLAYFVIYVALQIISNSALGSFAFTASNVSHFNILYPTFNSYINATLLFQAVFAGVFLVITNFIFSRKLNLD